MSTAPGPFEPTRLLVGSAAGARTHHREAVRALVEPCDGASVDEAALIEHVKSHLATYKAPKRIIEIDTVGRAANTGR